MGNVAGGEVESGSEMWENNDAPTAWGAGWQKGIRAG